VAVWSLGAASLVIANPAWVQWLELQTQSLMFQLRLGGSPPADIVILAIDDKTMSEVSRWPLPRKTYAAVIDKIMQAQARGVAVDILWDFPSSYGEAGPDSTLCQGEPLSPDDRALQTVLARYPDRLALATKFELVRDGGLDQMRLVLPYCPFQTVHAKLGNIDFGVEGDGKVHQLGAQWLQDLVRTAPVYQEMLDESQIQTFAQAALAASQLPYAPPQGSHIFFYGGPQTFATFSFADVLQPENWTSRLQNGAVFQNKLVLIGLTADNPGDVVETPVGPLPGVELHANAIATLLQGKTLRPWLPTVWLSGTAILAVSCVAAYLQTRPQRPLQRFLIAVLLALGWGGCGYGVMLYGHRLVPVAVPMLAIGLTGCSYLGTYWVRERQIRKQLEDSLKDHSRDPVVRDIINQQTDDVLKQQLLQGRQQELLGTKIGGGRYQIIQVHASGGFGETYIAADLQRPGTPKCVVKHLAPARNHLKHIRLAQRLFQREAETLERLGRLHDQIPQLLAYFNEQSEFYLVQEFIAGHPLNQEIPLGLQFPEAKTISVLRETLHILDFIHSQGVIHRDIKPSNLIRRAYDNKLVLIDFGAVKAIQTIGEEEQVSDLTVGIGTQGYIAPEQQAGHPQLNSDLYALGMIGVQMLTGHFPSHLKRDRLTGEIDWQSKTHASRGLIEVVSHMIRFDYQQRYQRAAEVLQDLRHLSHPATLPTLLDEMLQDHRPTAEELQETQPWPTTFERDEEPPLPPTQPPPTSP
jgi:CHASE2 domain-containing sensor protein/tRNA A-37 threonylcarbamoyl transferase component Bud32